MHLCSGRIMLNPEHQSTSEPRSSLKQTIEDLAKSFHNLLDRVEQIEASQRETINHERDSMLRQNNHGYFNRDPNLNMITIITMTLGIMMIECSRKR